MLNLTMIITSKKKSYNLNSIFAYLMSSWNVDEFVKGWYFGPRINFSMLFYIKHKFLTRSTADSSSVTKPNSFSSPFSTDS